MCAIPSLLGSVAEITVIIIIPTVITFCHVLYVSIYVCVCMYVCMYVCIYVCMYVCMYTCIHVCYTHKNAIVIDNIPSIMMVYTHILHICLYTCVYIHTYACGVDSKKMKCGLETIDDGFPASLGIGGEGQLCSNLLASAARTIVTAYVVYYLY